MRHEDRRGDNTGQRDDHARRKSEVEKGELEGLEARRKRPKPGEETTQGREITPHDVKAKWKRENLRDLKREENGRDVKRSGKGRT